MNPKAVAIIVVVIGLVIVGFTAISKTREDILIDNYIQVNGSCYLSDGTCLHDDRDLTLYVVGYIFAAVLIVLGVYMLFDDSQEKLMEHQKHISKNLHESKKDERFKAFLAGFNEEEQKVLSAIKEQDGIKQATLRYRTGISKSSLSLLLKSLEDRNLISRKPDGKTNKVFLQKKY